MKVVNNSPTKILAIERTAIKVIALFFNSKYHRGMFVLAEVVCFEAGFLTTSVYP